MKIQSIQTTNTYKNQKTFKGLGSSELNKLERFVCDEVQDEDFFKLVGDTVGMTKGLEIPLTMDKTKAFLEKACEILKIKNPKIPADKESTLIVEREFTGDNPTSVLLNIDDKNVFHFYNARAFGDQ